MKNRWAQGIPPRYFTWVLKDQMAVSERPGGYSRNHRRVRRHEEILWLRHEGFERIVSLLPSEHNLHAYEELEVVYSHLPLASNDDAKNKLPLIYQQLQTWLDAGERVLLHREELGDDMMGFLAGYLIWSKRIPTTTQAVVVVERLMQKQMGSEGRQLVASLTAENAAAAPSDTE